MSIQNDVTEAMKAAMKNREADRLRALRNIRAGFLLALKEAGDTDLSDERSIEVLRRLAKQRKDSIDAYTAAERPDLADQESAELAVVEEFLPKAPSEDTVRGWVAAAIAATGATTAREMGKVMGQVMKDHKGEVDGAVVRRLATELLGG